MKIIARIYNDYTDKFGVPRQPGLADVPGRIVFEPEYRREEALRGLDGFDYIWLIWAFDRPFANAAPGGDADAERGERPSWSPTVRPPRLGGNRRMGVFATRSPNRPNPIGLSAVRLDRIENDPELGPVLYVSGADLLNETPIYDVKPYVPLSDAHPDARGGFTEENADYTLEVDFPEALLRKIPEGKRKGLLDVLAQDPRPSYKEDGDRSYGLTFGAWNLRFTVKEKTLTVTAVEPAAESE